MKVQNEYSIEKKEKIRIEYCTMVTLTNPDCLFLA